MNTINPVNNVSFGGRYLNLNKMENLPTNVYQAILKNQSIDTFLKEGKPKTLIAKILDMFRKDEMIEADYFESELTDSYAKTCKLTFVYRKRDGSFKIAPLSTEQQGIRRQSGSIPKPNEHYLYKPPFITAEEKLAKEIENIKDFKGMLK